MTTKVRAQQAGVEGHNGVRFGGTTHWTLVVQAADGGTPDGQAALEELCRTYWKPLYSFARRQGLAPVDAEDLTQGFFADFLARGAITRADPSRGHFRSFLLASFRNFHSHQRAGAASLKRGGGQVFVSIEELREAEAQFCQEPAVTGSPDVLYDRKWAGCLLGNALAVVSREYAALGKAALFDELKAMLGGGRSTSGYAEIACRLGTTEGAIKVAAFRLRRRFGDQLRADVAKTLLRPEDVEDELRHLLASVSG